MEDKPLRHSEANGDRAFPADQPRASQDQVSGTPSITPWVGRYSDSRRVEDEMSSAAGSRQRRVQQPFSTGNQNGPGIAEDCAATGHPLLALIHSSQRRLTCRNRLVRPARGDGRDAARTTDRRFSA